MGKYINFNDERIPVGKRKVAYVKYAVAHGTPLEVAKKQANRKFGYERKGKYIVRIGNARDMDLPSMRGYTWAQAAMDAGAPHPDKCVSLIVLCDSVYSPFDLADGFSVLPNSWGKTLPDWPTWENCEDWAKAHGYKVCGINWICS